MGLLEDAADQVGLDPVSGKAHTPGPWVQAGESNGLRFIKANGRDVARVGIAYEDCNEYDARLIAAAPDLLEAAKLTLRMLQQEAIERPIESALRAAIAKAEGR